MPLAYARRDHRRAPGLPARRGGLRRQPPRHRAGGRARRLRPPAGGADQRPPQGRPGTGPVHPPARRGRRLGRGRHHRVVARRRRLRRHAQRLQHRPGGGGHRRRGHHRPRGPSSPSRAPTPGRRLATVVPEAADVPRFGVRRSNGKAAPCVAAGTGYTGEDGFEVRRPGRRRRPRCGRPSWPPASPRPGWAPATPSASRRRCPSTGTSSAPASPPCRPDSAGWSGGTRTDFRGRAALAAERRARRRPAAWSAWPPRAASRPARGRPCSTPADPSARSPAATSRPCWSTGSPWPSSTRRSTPQPGRVLDLEQRGKVRPATVVETPFVRPGSGPTPMTASPAGVRWSTVHRPEH